MSKKQIVRWVIAVLCILFVPVCGSPISVVLLLGAAITVAPVKAIQQHLKKPLNIIIPVVFFVAAVMAAPNTTSQKAEEPAPTATPEATATQEPTPEITATPEPTEEPLQETSDSTDNSDMKFFAAIVEYAASQSYEEGKYKVEYDDNSITLSVWGDNISMGAVLAASGNEEAKQAWESSIVDANVKLNKQIVEQAKENGLDDAIIMTNVLNDANLDNTLLSVVNGVVVYDCVADS